MTAAKPPAEGQDIRFLREQVAYYEQQAADWRQHLADALAERGSRPGDGSDQPAFFQTKAQERLS